MYELSFITLSLNDNPRATLVDIGLAINLNPDIDNVTDVEIVFTFTVVSIIVKNWTAIYIIKISFSNFSFDLRGKQPIL